MTPQQLIDFRARMGWTQSELARRLELSQSRISDYEKGQTRGKPPRRAPIPRVVEYACNWLAEHARPLSPEEKAELWSDDQNWPLYSGPPIDDSRDALYDEPPGR